MDLNEELNNLKLREKISVSLAEATKAVKNAKSPAEILVAEKTVNQLQTEMDELQTGHVIELNEARPGHFRISNNYTNRKDLKRLSR